MLTKEQAQENLKKYGPNELEERNKRSTFRIFLDQFKDFLVIILIISAVVSGFLGDVESAIVIFVVITMNAILGTGQTVKAEQSLIRLKQLSAPDAKVMRDGQLMQLSLIHIYFRCRHDRVFIHQHGADHRAFCFVVMRRYSFDHCFIHVVYSSPVFSPQNHFRFRLS